MSKLSTGSIQLSDKDRDDSRSVRVNVRIPRKQYELMRKFGETLGMDTDGGCLKHFLAVGIQASAGGIASLQVVESNAQAVGELKRMNDSVDYAKQLDLVEQAAKQVRKPPSRGRT
jgi:hypothetical protein